MNKVFYNVKGGQGTTVTACAYALTLAQVGIDVLLVDYRGDIPAVMGVAEPEPYEAVEIAPNLRMIRADRADIAVTAVQIPFAEVYVYDADAGDVADLEYRYGAEPVLVTRCCYLALRRAVASKIAPHSAVVISEPGRAVIPADVEGIFDVPVTTITWDPAIARAVDAGLLVSRLPQALKALQTA